MGSFRGGKCAAFIFASLENVCNFQTNDFAPLIAMFCHLKIEVRAGIRNQTESRVNCSLLYTGRKNTELVKVTRKTDSRKM